MNKYKNLYTVHIQYFWQGHHLIYGHIQCVFTVLAKPVYLRCSKQVANTHTVTFVCVYDSGYYKTQLQIICSHFIPLRIQFRGRLGCVVPLSWRLCNLQATPKAVVKVIFILQGEKQSRIPCSISKQNTKQKCSRSAHERNSSPC